MTLPLLCLLWYVLRPIHPILSCFFFAAKTRKKNIFYGRTRVNLMFCRLYPPRSRFSQLASPFFYTLGVTNGFARHREGGICGETLPASGFVACMYQVSTMYLGVASRTCKTSPIVDPRSEYQEQWRVIAHSAYSVCTPPDGTTPLFLLFPVLFRRASSCSERHPSFRCCYLCRTLLPLLVPLFSSSQLCFCALCVCTTVCSF